MEAATIIENYMQQVRRKTLDPKPYERLMIYYRLQKQLKKELQLIDKAIALFTKKQVSAGRHSVVVERLSRLLGASTGLMTRSGKQLYIPGSVQKWMRRKDALLKKLR